jgi:polysaccharide deacetylase family protein (PEP-CTERM system associated)
MGKAATDRSGARPLNVFSFDVEEWFHVRRPEDDLPADAWPDLAVRLPHCLETIVALLEETGNRATFFWLGWCAERHGEWVRRLAEAGHEIACHGWDHRALDRLTPETFRDQLRSTRALLEDLAGRAVRGYRAPSLSLGPATAWMLDVLIDEGFAYDSSLMPTSIRPNLPKRPTYTWKATGDRGTRLERLLRNPHPSRWETDKGSIVELPLATRPWGPFNLPFGGGLYFRLIPYGLIPPAVRWLNARSIPATMYAHPWEFDDDPPRLPASLPWRERFCHSYGLARGRRDYTRLLGEFRFVTAGEVADQLATHAPD